MTFHPEQDPPTTTESRAGASGMEKLLDAYAAIADDLGLDTVLERVVSAACELVDARYGALGVIGPDRTLSHFVSVGLESEEIRRIGPLPRGHGVLGQLITDPRPLRLGDLRRHPSAYGFPAHHPTMTSFLGVPVRVHGQVFGNLYLTERNGGVDFSEADERLVVALASAAGVAIENFRLFDEASRRAHWLEGGLEAVRDLLAQHQDTHRDLELLAQHALRASRSVVAVVLSSFGRDGGLICEAADGADIHALLGRQSLRTEALDDAVPLAPVLLTGGALACLLPGAPAGSIDTALCSRLAGDGDQRFLLVGRAPGATPFSDADREMMPSFASHVSLALELLRVHRQREQEAVFGDRDRIARDLHDVVIQRLFAAGLSVQSLRTFAPGPEPQARIATITTELDATIKELRDTIYSLRARPQAGPGFTSSVFTLIADAFDGHELEPVIQLSGPLDSALDTERQDHVRAVLLESLANVLRHARARSVTVALQVSEGKLELRVGDDGVGFTDPPRSSGLSNMWRRAELCNGSLVITSAPGAGTEVLLTVPLAPRGPDQSSSREMKTAAWVRH